MATERQISAAHDAWERVTSEWQLRKVSNYGMAGDTWILQNVGAPRLEAGRDYVNEIAVHKFDGADAEQSARFLFRRKVIEAVLAATKGD